MEHADSIASLSLFHVMGREHDRRAVALAQMGQMVGEIAARGRIESGARLVEQQDLRLMEQRLGQLDAALKPARERFDQIGGACVKSKAREHRRDSLAQAAAGDSVQMPVMAQILGHGQLAVEARMLKDNAEPAADAVVSPRRSRPSIAAEPD